MNKVNFSQIAKSLRETITKHSPEILTAIGIAGMVTTTVMAVKATPKAITLIEEEKQRQNDNNPEVPVVKLKAKDVVKVTWKCYIPATVTGALSIACLIGASATNLKRNAALATAYTLSETALKEYQEKVIETIGEKKELAIKDAIAKDKVERDPVSKREVIITERGNTLCYDAHSGRYFRSDIDKIKKAENALNHRMMNEQYVSLNDLYAEIGLSSTKLGDDLGWNVDRGLIDIFFSSQLADDGTPCLVMEYNLAPKYNYDRFI